GGDSQRLEPKGSSPAIRRQCVPGHETSASSACQGATAGASQARQAAGASGAPDATFTADAAVSASAIHATVAQDAVLAADTTNTADATAATLSDPNDDDHHDHETCPLGRGPSAVGTARLDRAARQRVPGPRCPQHGAGDRRPISGLRRREGTGVPHGHSAASR
ncbi:unnamed protein product, partial [Ixodes hexagonus]